MHCLFFVEFLLRIDRGKGVNATMRKKMETNGSVKGAFVMLKSELIQQLADQIWEAGDIVITGSQNPAVYIDAGDHFEADFGQLGRIYADFI